MTSEFTKNLPHIIAIAILIFALLVVSTKAGLVRCSSLGNQFCQIMDTIFGKPKIVIVYGDEGIGDPIAMKKSIESLWKVPVQTIHINDLSSGMLDDYNLVIVEKARMIPTPKLKIFYDYIMKKVDGRLVWVGDAGTFGESNDQSCRDLKFSIRYKERSTNTTRLTSASHTEQVCIKESEAGLENTTLFQSVINRKETLAKKAWSELSEKCADFGGELQPVKETLGYRCDLPTTSDYSEMFFVWENEEDFKKILNPWDRGEYYIPGVEEPQQGFDFGSMVLGISFIADDFAVKNYQEYEEDLTKIREYLVTAHDGLVECSKLKSTKGCSVSRELAKVKEDLREIKLLRDNLKITLSSITTTLDSIATQKEASNDTSGALLVRDSVSKISNKGDSIMQIEIPEGAPSIDEIQTIKTIPSSVDEMNSDLWVLEGSETDDTVKQQYEGMINQLNESKISFGSAIASLEMDTRSYESCKTTGSSTVEGALISVLGSKYSDELGLLLSYASPLTDDAGALSLMTQATDENGLKPEWRTLRDKLMTIDESKVCDEQSDKAKKAFVALASALDRMDFAAKKPVVYEAIPTLVVSDRDHTLVRGISRAVDLKIDGIPVPFVLVGTNPDARVVAQLRVTPNYAGRQYWPAITAREPKFGTHTFGRGTVIYYAFPPEVEEQLINNMIEFLLY